MSKDQYVGTQEILSVSRLGNGSTTPLYSCQVFGLGRLKHNEFIVKFAGSFGLAGSSPYAEIFGGIAGTPLSELALQSADMIGSMYLGTGHSKIRARVKPMSTSGALMLRGRVINANAGSPLWGVKLVIGRTIAAV